MEPLQTPHAAFGRILPAPNLKPGAQTIFGVFEHFSIGNGRSAIGQPPVVARASQRLGAAAPVRFGAVRVGVRDTNGASIALEAVSVTYVSGPPWERRHLEAVRSVDLRIAKGETMGLVGESGSGKTTIGRLCLGMLKPTTGRALFEGAQLGRDRRRLRGRLQVVLQHPEWSLNPRLSVGTSVAEPLSILGAGNGHQKQSKVSEMLERVGLTASIAKRYPHELSGGQRQRVAIARALVTKPQFIVFDEAVSALDVSVQAQILNLIQSLQSDHHFAALFISHDLAAVRYVSHRIAVMYAGEVVEVAPAARFYSRTLHPYSRALRLSVADSEDKGFELRPAVEGVAASGCPLHLRCPMSIERCVTEKPALRVVEDETSACHRAEELAI